MGAHTGPYQSCSSNLHFGSADHIPYRNTTIVKRSNACCIVCASSFSWIISSAQFKWPIKVNEMVFLSSKLRIRASIKLKGSHLASLLHYEIKVSEPKRSNDFHRTKPYISILWTLIMANCPTMTIRSTGSIIVNSNK